MAQTPPLSPLPSLPPLPNPTQASPGALPALPAINLPATAPAPAAPAQPKTPSATLAPLPTPVANNAPKALEPLPGSEDPKPEPESEPVVPNPNIVATPSVPALPAFPSVPGFPAPPLAEPDGSAGTTTEVPEILVTPEAPSAAPVLAKSWQGKLAPTVTPYKTTFNYKRAVLPGVIYRRQYDRENRHLPRRVTREDYENRLFTSVARNDIETTRALLNAGTSLDATNPYGETPLMLAERLGARDVAALLVARGGR